MSDEEIGKGLMTLNIIWFAMLVSLAIYLFVGLHVSGNLEGSMDQDTFATLKYSLYIVTFITLIITRYVRKLILSAKGGCKQAANNSRSLGQNPAFQKYATASIVAWAMSESIGIYGLVLFFLGKNTSDLYLFILVSAAAMFMYRPKKDEILSLSKDSLEITNVGVT